MPRWTPQRVEELREAVASSRPIAEVLRRLRMRAAGGNFATITRLVAQHDISVAHFDPHASNRVGGRRRRRPLAEVLVQGSTFQRHALKRRLFDEGNKERHCELCGQGEEWRGRRMSLILGHINGVHDDNRLENLRIVCPNCNATLDTHCGRNKREPPRTRDCAHCGATFRPASAQQLLCSRRCGLVVGHLKTRRVDRPSLVQLRREIDETSCAAVGRKYGVSDNAIRKWVVAAMAEADGIRYRPPASNREGSPA